MIDKDCLSLIFVIVCQLVRGISVIKSQTDEDEDPSSLKLKQGKH